MTHFKVFSALAIISGVVFTGCASNPAVPSVRLSTEAELAPVLDRKLEFQNDQFLYIHSDGEVTGWFNETNILGTWEMQDGYWCRTLTKTSSPTNQVLDCQEFNLRGNQLTVRRDKGAGNQFTYVVGAILGS